MQLNLAPGSRPEKTDKAGGAPSSRVGDVTPKEGL